MTHPPSKPTSYDVRVWSVITYERRQGRTYGVRWSVAGQRQHRTFRSKALAESFRAELLTLTRQGTAFEVAAGLPPAAVAEVTGPSWYEHACGFVDANWARLAPRSRQSIGDALASVSLSLLAKENGRPSDKKVRAALYRWSFNSACRKAGPPPPALAPAVAWIERNAIPLAALKEPRKVREVLDALSLNLDGSAAAATTIARRRAVLHNALRYAVELGHFDGNPLDRVRWSAPKVADAVDRRVVVNHDQAQALLAAVGAQDGIGPHLVAFFGCMYYAALRPAEVVALRKGDLELPASGDGWGELRLSRSDPTTAAAWTNNGTREARHLKHRATRDVRIVPCVPPLTRLLAAHLADFPGGPEGRLFSGAAGGPVPEVAYGKVWAEARLRALGADVDSPLARRPYDLRHAAVSTWLNAGVDPTQVAEWAGHSLHVLLKVYAKCIVGRDELARRRVAEILGESQ